MTLQNLLRLGRLKAHSATAAKVQHLLATVERNLHDAAYKSVMQCALGVDTTTWMLLDTLRRRRNANDHTGDGVTQT